MQNQVWEEVGAFLNRLRCENVARGTAVEVPGYKELQKELELQRVFCEELLSQQPQEIQSRLLEWMEKLEYMSSLEGQKAYLQGYVDCILLLEGMGLLEQGPSPEELMERIRQ